MSDGESYECLGEGSPGGAVSPVPNNKGWVPSLVISTTVQLYKNVYINSPHFFYFCLFLFIYFYTYYVWKEHFKFTIQIFEIQIKLIKFKEFKRRHKTSTAILLAIFSGHLKVKFNSFPFHSFNKNYILLQFIFFINAY